MNKESTNALRLLNAVLLLIVAAFLLACITAPWIFNGLIALGRNVAVLEELRDLRFEEIISRLVLIYLILGFYPAVRLGGASSFAPLGLTRDVPRIRAIGRGWLLGVVSVGALYVLGAVTGILVWAPDSWGRLVGRIIGYFIGGLLIGVIEEVFFRGALFGLLRRLVHWVPAALAVSAFFSFVHFLRPDSPTGIVYGEWYTGFALVPHMFHTTDQPGFYIPFALTLFVMSLVLCVLYRRHGHLYMIIGLHAGWVLALGAGRFFFDRATQVESVFFGTSVNLARSWAALTLLVLMLIWAAVPKTKRR